MAANGKTLEYLIKEGLVRVSAENTDYVIIKTFTNPRGTQSTAAQTSEYAVKLSDFLAALEESADIAAIQAALTAHINDTTDAHDASAVSYVNTTSGLTATDVQAALDEIAASVPTPVYTVLTGVIAQSGASAPFVSNTMENTLTFVPTFTYISPGLYSIDNPAFVPAKTFFMFQDRLSGTKVYADTLSSPGYIVVRSLDATNTLANDILNGVFEIRVYN